MQQVLLMTKDQVASKELQCEEITCADFLFCKEKKKKSLSSNIFSLLLLLLLLFFLLNTLTFFFVYQILQHF